MSLVCAGFLVALVSSVSACEAQDMPESTLDETVTNLKAKASDAPVRVIVKVEATAGDPTSAAQVSKTEILETMQSAGVTEIQSIEGQPLMVLELTAEQLDHLLATGLVESIQEDEPEGLY